MKNSIVKRIEVLENATHICKIEEGDRMIIISYKDGEKAEADRLVQERMADMRLKYGSDISENDFDIVFIRKFYK